MKKLLLASTSTLYGGRYLDYIKDEIVAHFSGVKEIVFIPYARPGGISHDDYTAKAATFFSGIGIAVKGLHSFESPISALQQAEGYFTGGGNTFLLVKSLHEQGLMKELKHQAKAGKPYMGASAGTNIAGLSMRTTNDMPIVYPPSFDCMGLVPFNINPHYLDPVPNLQHNGETRETRLLEFLTQNNVPVVGLREGSWLQVLGNEVLLKGSHTSRIFVQGTEPYEMKSGSLVKF